MSMNDPYRASARGPLTGGVPLAGGAPLAGGGAKPKKSKKSKKPKKPKKVKSGETKIFRILAVMLASVAVVTLFTLNSGNDLEYVYVITAGENIAPRIAVSDSSHTPKKIEEVFLEEDTIYAETAEKALEMLVEFESLTYSHPVYKGQQIRKTMLTTSDGLRPDERLVAVSAKAVRAVAATVKSGDRVDIYVSRSDGLTILLGQAVEVVAVTLDSSQLDSIAAEQLTNPDLKLSDYTAGSPIGGTYILRVPAKDVAKYIASDVAGILTLSTRSSSGVYEEPVAVDIYGIICPDVTSPQCERSR